MIPKNLLRYRPVFREALGNNETISGAIFVHKNIIIFKIEARESCNIRTKLDRTKAVMRLFDLCLSQSFFESCDYKWIE